MSTIASIIGFGRAASTMPPTWRFHQNRHAASGNAARRGVTLVELLIATLILTIVCVAWLKIIGMQSARKESRRREAVERLSGMIDAFLCYYKGIEFLDGVLGCYMLDNEDINKVSFKKDGTSDIVHPIFDGDVSPIGYQLCLVKKATLSADDGWNSTDGWHSASYWLVGRLYDGHGAVVDSGRQFFRLPVYVGQKKYP